MIVPEAFLPAMQPLVTLRQSLGLQVVVATAEDVYDEFNGRQALGLGAAPIRQVRVQPLEHALPAAGRRRHAGPDQQRAAHGSRLDPRQPDCPAPVRVGEGYEITVSDNIYGCITGNCDPISPGGDVIPELMIGRLPVNSLADAQVVVAKLVAYEDLSGDQGWRRHLLLCSDDAFSGDAFSSFGGGAAAGYCLKDYELHFVGLNQKIRSIVQRDAGLAQMNVENLNLSDYLTDAEVPVTVDMFGNRCRDRAVARQHTHAGVTPTLFAHLNAGTMWWNYQGHANEYVLTHEDLYINSNDSPGGDDKFLFANTNQPVIFTAFCVPRQHVRAQRGRGGIRARAAASARTW